jgi:hypothetical protein
MTHDELVEKIAILLWHVTLQQRLRNFPSSTSDQWEACSDSDKNEWREWASVAVRAAVEDMLVEPTLEEVGSTSSDHEKGYLNSFHFDRIKQLFVSRRLRFTKIKSLEERVTVEEVHTTSLNYSADCAFTVMTDGKPTGPLYSTREYAETYRLGIIQQLKEP